MIIVQIIAGIVSFSALASLCVYIYLLNKGENSILYETTHSLSIGQKTFQALAAFAFLWCIFAGAEAMLWWVPSNWGSNDEDGNYTTLRTFLAFYVTFAGLYLLQFIETSSRDKYRLIKSLEKITELEKLLHGLH